MNIAKLDNKELKSIVESGELSKQELIALGYIRFGIPESGMKRLSKIHNWLVLRRPKTFSIEKISHKFSKLSSILIREKVPEGLFINPSSTF